MRREEKRAWKDDTCKGGWERENEGMERRERREGKTWWERSDR